MSIFANIDDKVLILNTEFTIIGISVMIYKNEFSKYDDAFNLVNYSELNYVCEYKLKKILDNSIWYLEENFIENILYIYTSHITNNIDIISKSWHNFNYYILNSIGDCDFKSTILSLIVIIKIKIRLF